LLERTQLGASMVERLGTESGNGAVVGNCAKRRAHDGGQLLYFLARLADVGPAVDRSGAVLDLLVQVGNAFLERFELFGEFLDRSERVGLARRLGRGSGERQDGGKEQSGRHAAAGFKTACCKTPDNGLLQGSHPP